MVPQICEFLGLEKKLPISGDENVKVKIYEKYTLNVPNNLSLWQDSDCTEYLIAKESILPVRPQIELVPSLSRITRSGRQITRSGRQMVFQVENIDMIESFTQRRVDK